MKVRDQWGGSTAIVGIEFLRQKLGKGGHFRLGTRATYVTIYGFHSRVKERAIAQHAAWPNGPTQRVAKYERRITYVTE